MRRPVVRQAMGRPTTRSLNVGSVRSVAERRTRLPNASRGRRSVEFDAEALEKRRTGRTVRGRRTREQLVAAARIVFERDGFLHARIGDICDEAGTSHGSFYTYFVAKEEIFREVVESVEVDLLAIEAVPEGADPVAGIRAANRHYLETYRDNARIMAVIQQVATFDTGVRDTRVRRHDVFAEAIERRTRVYQQQGIADPRVDPRYAAQALAGMVASFADRLFTQAQNDGFDLDTAVDQLTMLWANALGVPHKIATAESV